MKKQVETAQSQNSELAAKLKVQNLHVLVMTSQGEAGGVATENSGPHGCKNRVPAIPVGAGPHAHGRLSRCVATV